MDASFRQRGFLGLAAIVASLSHCSGANDLLGGRTGDASADGARDSASTVSEASGSSSGGVSSGTSGSSSGASPDSGSGSGSSSGSGSGTSSGSGSGSDSGGATTCADPDTPAPCTSCMTSGNNPCQNNGCYGGYLCDTSTDKCKAPGSCP